MFELSPEMANREDSRYWYIDSKILGPTKPGDIVIIDSVVGEKFGHYNRVRELGLAATFLGMFKGDVHDAGTLIDFLVEDNDSELSSVEINKFSRHPYFKAYFEGIGEITFAGIECCWFPN